MLTKTIGLAAALLISQGAVLSAQAASSPATGTFQVMMTINQACTVTAGAGSNINLGTVDATATNTAGSSTINVACSKTTPYYIGLAPSNGNANGAGAMAANTTGVTDTVPYQLYSNSAHSAVWGNTASSSGVGNGVAGTGAGIANAASIPVYAVAPSADFTPGSYVDTVTVNVNF